MERAKEKRTENCRPPREWSYETSSSFTRSLIAKELPELLEKDQRLHDAMREPTPSGALRRAIHASRILLPDLADRAGTDMDTIDAFLIGERPLNSGVIDRLAKILKLKLEAMSAR